MGAAEHLPLPMEGEAWWAPDLGVQVLTQRGTGQLPQCCILRAKEVGGSSSSWVMVTPRLDRAKFA